MGDRADGGSECCNAIKKDTQPIDWMSYGASDEARTRNRHPTNSRWEFAGTLPDLGFERAHSARVEVATSRAKENPRPIGQGLIGASDEARTRYLHLGKVALYQMSYTRNSELYYSTNLACVNSFFEN